MSCGAQYHMAQAVVEPVAAAVHFGPMYQKDYCFVADSADSWIVPSYQRDYCLVSVPAGSYSRLEYRKGWHPVAGSAGS